MSETGKCLICGTEADYEKEPNDFHIFIFNYTCPVCGKYCVNMDFIQRFDNPKAKNDLEDKRFLITGRIRELGSKDHPIKISFFKFNDPNDKWYFVDDLIETANTPKDALEAVDRLLLYIKDNSRKFREMVPFDATQVYPIIYAKDSYEFYGIVEYAQEMRYIVTKDNFSITDNSFRLAIEGWERVRELQKVTSDPEQAFVAMSFDPSMDEIYEKAIDPALYETGYKRPFRVDKERHNDLIDNKIIAKIRKSSLVVADFTGGNQGAYYEAGLAKGLGKEVIYICKNSEKLHFDTNHIFHIFYDNPEELKEKLIDQIEATVSGQPRKSR